MRDRPIIFSAPMVRAILEGRKMVTRRVVKPQYATEAWSVRPKPSPDAAGRTHDWWLPEAGAPFSSLPRCPYGQVGNRLWVRETTFRMPHPADAGLTPADMPRTWQAACDVAGQILYRADMESRAADLAMSDGERWTPSIHMPKAWARIWLEVTAVRVERLQDITEDQAEAEGVAPRFLCDDDVVRPSPRYVNGFRMLWDDLVKDGTRWADNPWVWVVEFRRMEAPHADQA